MGKGDLTHKTIQFRLTVQETIRTRRYARGLLEGERGPYILCVWRQCMSVIHCTTNNMYIHLYVHVHVYSYVIHSSMSKVL